MGSCGTSFSESPLALVLKVIVALLCIMETRIAKEGVQEVGRDGEVGNGIEAYDQDFSL